MNKIVPERYNYIGVFLSLRCNLKCPYCINKHSTFKNRAELDTQDWIDILNHLVLNKDIAITLEGGEPSLHKGFFDIIEHVKHKVDILTNLQFDVEEFIGKVDPSWMNKGRKSFYKSIRISYHNQDQDTLLEKASKLQNAGFNIGIFSVNLPEKVVDNMEMAEKARKKQIYYFIKDFLGYKDGQLFGYFKYPEALNNNRKEVLCRTKELLIAPDGSVFRCHRDLYANENLIGNIADSDFTIEDIYRPCNNFGICSACDIKLKTNRFLEMGSCSIDIKEKS